MLAVPTSPTAECWHLAGGRDRKLPPRSLRRGELRLPVPAWLRCGIAQQLGEGFICSSISGLGVLTSMG